MKIASYKEDNQRMPYIKTFNHNGITIKVKAGDFSEIMQKVVHYLENSYFYVANEN